MANENYPAQTDGPAAGMSRRRLLTASAGLGAAGLAAGVFVNASSGATLAAGTTHAQPAQAGDVDEPVVAHVRDARTGELDLFVGTRHIRLRDPQLAAGLLRAAH